MCMKAECHVHAKRARQRDRGHCGREDELLDVYNPDGRYGEQYGLPQGIRGPPDLPPLRRRGRDPRMDMLNGLGGGLFGIGGGLGIPVGLGGLNGGLPGGPRSIGPVDFGLGGSLPPGLGGGMGMGLDIMGQPHGLGGPGLLGRDPRLGGMRGEQFVPGVPAPHRGFGMRGMLGMEGPGGNIDAQFLPDLSGRFNAMELGDPTGYAHPRLQQLPGQDFYVRDGRAQRHHGLGYGRADLRDDLHDHEGRLGAQQRIMRRGSSENHRRSGSRSPPHESDSSCGWDGTYLKVMGQNIGRRIRLVPGDVMRLEKGEEMRKRQYR